jgi:hypothetical protein
VPFTDAPVIAPAGSVCPPLVAKTVSVAAPLPEVVAVVLVVGTQTASKEHVAEMTLLYEAAVDATGPEASAYTQHKNL